MTWLGASNVRHLLGATCAASLGGLVAAASTLPTILSPDSILYQPSKLLTADGALAAAREFWVIFGPGGKLHPAYFLEHKGHLVVEGVLLAIILYMFLQTSFKPKPRAEEALTDKEIDQLCKEWEPLPLVPKLGPDDALPPPPVISERDGAYVVVDGRRVLNLAACDFFNMTDTAPLKDASAQTIAQYGVGSCGPRSFYGTIDVHLTLEDELAKFMGTAECIIYSYDLATVASVIPCFASRKDTLVMDEYCNYAIVSGAQLSRARVLTFKHNDLADLERVLQRVEQEDRAAKKPLYRRMLLVEGLYAGYGDLAPLKELVAIKEKYKYNLLVDESYSFGVLGKTGRGAVEHAGLKPEQVEIICATMGNALASAGGFCVGSKDVVEHQRLASTGYVFSASLPPYLATAVSESLRNLTQNVEVLQARLAQASTLLRREIKKVPEFKLLNDSGLSALPLLLVALAKPPADAKQHERLLAQVKEHLLAKGGVLVATTVSSFLEPSKPPASLRVHACALVGAREVEQLVAALRQAAVELGLQA